MTAKPDESTCQVAVLVPKSPDAASVLCDDVTTALTLPVVTVDAEPATSLVVDAIAARLGRAPTLLRANAVAWHENWDAAAMVVEVEPLAGEPPLGTSWRVIRRGEDELVQPGWARPTVAGWLEERANGWDDRRPQWSRPGWFAEASGWMLDQMRSAGFEEPRPPTLHYLWGASALLVADSLDGRAFLKASPQRFRHEGAVTQALASRTPAALPDVVAVDAGRGWMLMRDFGASDLGEAAAATWGAGLKALAQLQRAWLGAGPELLALGTERRPLDELATWIAATAEDDDLLGRMPAEDRAHWTATLPDLVSACHRLSDLGPDETLVHGDFHPWNVVLREDGPLVFDWTDAALGHPFVDLVTYVMRSRDVALRRPMALAYLEHWRDVVPNACSDEVIELSLVVGGLYQVQTYSQLLPTLLPQDLSNLASGDVEWMQRALRFRAEGLAAAY